MNWLGWAIVASGISAAYFWKKANPGKSLNPTVGKESNRFYSSGFGKDVDD